MRRLVVSAIAAMTFALLTTPLLKAGQESKPVDEAMKIAIKLTEEGATTFDTFNAKAMAAFYLDDAEVALVTKDENGLKLDVHKGRADIEKFYADMFKKPETIKSKNDVEYAKLIAPDVLVIAGVFHVNSLKADAPKIPFYQVRVKKGDQWLMSSVRIYFLPPQK
jgi:ketosteroid isomerase-like protein